MRAIPLQGILCSGNLLNEEKRDDERQYLQRRLAKGDRKGMNSIHNRVEEIILAEIVYE